MTAPEFSNTGRITRVDDRSFESASAPTAQPPREQPKQNKRPAQRSLLGKVLQGIACRYGKVHEFRGGLDMFVAGVFKSSLATGQPFDFRLMHDPGRRVASTEDRVELFEDQHGLAFRLHLLDHDQEIASMIARGENGMSVCYRVKRSEMRKINGEDVRVILDVDLIEISLCDYPSVSEAFAVLVDGNRRSLAEEARSGSLLIDGALAPAVRYGQHVPSKALMADLVEAVRLRGVRH